MAKSFTQSAQSKDQIAQRRLKERIIAYIKSEVKKADQIVHSIEVAEYLKQKFNEYQRKDVKAFDR